MEITVSEYHGKIDAASSGALHVEFFNKSEVVSHENGCPKYADREYVMIHYPGGKDRQVYPANDMHRRRWPRQYQAFKNVATEQLTGRPIAEWPVASGAQVDLLKVLQIYTVEQLAQASDSAIERVGLGGRELREKARLFVAEAQSGDGLASILGKMEEMQAELEAIKEENLALKKQGSDKKKDK